MTEYGRLLYGMGMENTEALSPSNDRDDVIRIIRTELRRRSGKAWSVKGGRGTAWGWITITAPPKRLDRYSLTPEDAAELGQLLGFDRPAHHQGESIPADSTYRTEYVDRARGLVPVRNGSPYWD